MELEIKRYKTKKHLSTVLTYIPSVHFNQAEYSLTKVQSNILIINFWFYVLRTKRATAAPRWTRAVLRLVAAPGEGELQMWWVSFFSLMFNYIIN